MLIGTGSHYGSPRLGLDGRLYSPGSDSRNSARRQLFGGRLGSPSAPSNTLHRSDRSLHVQVTGQGHTSSDANMRYSVTDPRRPPSECIKLRMLGMVTFNQI